MSTLYVVATPIGNLQDLSPRVCEVFRNVSLIAAEDTRVTATLLRYLDLRVPMVSSRQQNEKQMAAHIIGRMLAQEMDVAVVSDAGTPCISDPGAVLVREAIQAGISIVPVSGPSACVTALSACGWELTSFAFYGFLPRHAKEQKEKLAQIRQTNPGAAVFYESPHRVKDLIKNLSEVDNDCEIALFSDLTKLYERAYRGSCEKVLQELEENPNAEKGEYCLCVRFTPEEKKEEALSASDAYLLALFHGMEESEIEPFLQQKGFKRNEIYKAKLEMQNFFDE